MGRFDGALLIDGSAQASPPKAEPGVLDVSYECLRNGPAQSPDRPMVLPEVLDVLRRMPTRTGSWLSAKGGTGGIVQMRWRDARLWLETPHPENATSTGKHASLAEAEWAFSVLATDDGRSASSRAEDRVAIADLDGATTRPW